MTESAAGSPGGGNVGSSGDEPEQIPYMHDSDSAGTAAALVDAAYSAATRWWDVSYHRRAHAATASLDPDEPLIRTASARLQHTSPGLGRRQDSGGRKRTGRYSQGRSGRDRGEDHRAWRGRARAGGRRVMELAGATTQGVYKVYLHVHLSSMPCTIRQQRSGRNFSGGRHAWC